MCIHKHIHKHIKDIMWSQICVREIEVQKQSGPKLVDFKKVLAESPPGKLLELKGQVEDFASAFPTVGF